VSFRDGTKPCNETAGLICIVTLQALTRDKKAGGGAGSAPNGLQDGGGRLVPPIVDDCTWRRARIAEWGM